MDRCTRVSGRITSGMVEVLKKLLKECQNRVNGSKAVLLDGLNDYKLPTIKLLMRHVSSFQLEGGNFL